MRTGFVSTRHIDGIMQDVTLSMGAGMRRIMQEYPEAMEELKQDLSFQLSGSQRQEAVREVQQQLVDGVVAVRNWLAEDPQRHGRQLRVMMASQAPLKRACAPMVVYMHSDTRATAPQYCRESKLSEFL
mmetsp:Transcript_52344/g.122547  ORF Transcript_52344/g.122547 Transcript_52344/m.122547 type:complete len:129 (-) Transcript_52344:8-394(-)